MEKYINKNALIYFVSWEKILVFGIILVNKSFNLDHPKGIANKSLIH
jgi:hypothetical protein